MFNLRHRSKAPPSKEYLGYSLADRKFNKGEGSRKGAFQVLPDSAFDPDFETFYLDRLMCTQVTVGKRPTVCNEKTARMHWYNLRQFLSQLDLEQPIGLEACRKALTTDNLKAHFSRFETELTIRKDHFKPASVNLSGRSLSVAIQVLMSDRQG